MDQVGEDALGHGAAADVAVADEEYFYHCFVSPCFAPECPVLQGYRGFVKCVILLTSWQNRAIWSRL